MPEEISIDEPGREIKKDKSTEESSDFSGFTLFLILILLLLANQQTYGEYFQLFETQIKKTNILMEALGETANNLKVTFQSPQKIMNKL